MTSNKIISFLVLWAAIVDTFLTFAGRGGRAFSSSPEGSAQDREMPSTAQQRSRCSGWGWLSVPWVTLGFNVLGQVAAC